MNWQLMLDVFARSVEPITWQQPQHNIRCSQSERFEAVQYLEDKGFVRGTGKPMMWEITEAGRFVVIAGITKIGRRKPAGKEKRELELSLAQRTVAISPIDVFDLARVHKKWVRDDQNY